MNGPLESTTNFRSGRLHPKESVKKSITKGFPIHKKPRFFGNRIEPARRSYREFVAGGIPEGRRENLTGGVPIRSAGGWTAVKELKRSAIHL